MEHIVFGPDLELGIPVLDVQHRIIYDLLDGLECKQRPDFDVALRRLVEEMTEDMHEEDRLMVEIGYSGREAHQAAHARMLECLDHAMTLLAKGDECSARRAIHHLPEWIEAHINTMDLALAVALTRWK